RRQRQRSGSTLLGWESHTVKAHERTEAYLHDLGALAPTMNPNDLLLAEITSAYDVDPDGALGGGGGSGGGGSGGLGEGASATVRRAMHRDTGRPVAIKAISKRYLFTQAEQAGADREMVNQRRLCHRHVVRLYETYETDTELFLVLERATCGSLDDLLFVRRRLTELEAKIVLKQVLDAVQYCHAQGLQSSPLSISGLVVKLCDFGHSRKVPDVKYFKYTGDIHKIPHHLFQHTGTQGYISPEILLQNSYGKAADMWSCGVLMHKLLSGAVPWNSPRGCLQEPLALKARLWNDISDEAKDLLRGLLEVDQELRLSASQALNHAWFAGIEHCTAMPTYAPGGR
ncbi:kinase-like domain-containing protein, partial [Tribonema minus]